MEASRCSTAIRYAICVVLVLFCVNVPTTQAFQTEPIQAVLSSPAGVQSTVFADVPTAGKEWMRPWIEQFYRLGITDGCGVSPRNYCPETPVTRGAMAVFLLRAMNYPDLPYIPTNVEPDIFADVPTVGKEWMEPWIEEFYALGITGGCSQAPVSFCPEQSVTRAAMAVFILRALEGPDYVPPPAIGIFSDMPVAGKEWMVPWVEELYDRGITGGCGTAPARYCPENPVTRAAMAVFLLRAFDHLPQPVDMRAMDIHNYVVFYGNDRVDELDDYDFAIVDPESLDAPEIALLKSRGTTVIAYLSLGEVNPGVPWIDEVDEDWILATNPNWGSHYMDVTQVGWQNLVIDVADRILDKGYEGFFLDTVDTVDVYPAGLNSMINLIFRLWKTYPDAIIVQNRGFNADGHPYSVLSKTLSSIDGVMFEGLSTTYNFDTGQYGLADNSDVAEYLINQTAGSDVMILSLDYVPENNPSRAQQVVDIACSFGFLPAVSTIDLADIPNYGFTPSCD